MKVKICGITSAEALDATIDGGASHIGFVFHPGSPRYITPEQSKVLTNKTPSTMVNVGLFVNPRPDDITHILGYADLDMIQLHGNESPKDVQKIRYETGLSVMKAIRLATKNDLDEIKKFEQACDWLLFDTKSDKGLGGTGESFDWSILKNMEINKPWMLAGGLNSANIAEALSVLNPDTVDISSGVEDAPGVKNPEKIKKFIKTVKEL